MRHGLYDNHAFPRQMGQVNTAIAVRGLVELLRCDSEERNDLDQAGGEDQEPMPTRAPHRRSSHETPPKKAADQKTGTRTSDRT